MEYQITGIRKGAIARLISEANRHLSYPINSMAGPSGDRAAFASELLYLAKIGHLEIALPAQACRDNKDHKLVIEQNDLEYSVIN